MKWLEAEFWTRLVERIGTWLILAMPRAIAVAAGGWVAYRVVSALCRRIGRRLEASAISEGQGQEEIKRTQTIIEIARRAAGAAVLIIVLLTMLSELGVNVAPLLASAGVVGLAIGFGAQELVKDLVTGFFLLLENHVRIGDVAVINGTGGLVERIGLRTTVLRDLSGVVHVFRNGNISTLSNMTKTWSAMVFDVGIAYKEDTDQVTAVMREVADTMSAEDPWKEKILEPLEVFGVDAFAESAVVIKARLKTQPIAQWEVGREYRRRLKKAFDERGIEIPFPQRTLHWGVGQIPIPEASDSGSSTEKA